VDAVFGSVVGGASGQADEAAEGGAVDDGAAALLAHLPQFVLHAGPDAAQVDGVDAVEGVGGFVGGVGRRGPDAGVVERHVETAVGCDGLVDEGGDLLLVGHVALDAEGFMPALPQLCGGGRQDFGVDVSQDDRGSGLAECLRGGQAMRTPMPRRAIARRSFHHVSELGDHAVVEIREGKDPRDGVRFFVEFRVVTGPWWDWLCSLFPEYRDGRVPDMVVAVRSHALLPPPDQPEVQPSFFTAIDPVTGATSVRPIAQAAWVIKDGDAAASVAERVTRRVEQDGLPWLASMLERESLVVSFEGSASGDRVRIELLADIGDLVAMERLLEQKARNPGHDSTVASVLYYLRWIAPLFQRDTGGPVPDAHRYRWAAAVALLAAAASLALGVAAQPVLHALSGPLMVH
jgi:hypothetical protein